MGRSKALSVLSSARHGAVVQPARHAVEADGLKLGRQHVRQALPQIGIAASEKTLAKFWKVFQFAAASWAQKSLRRHCWALSCSRAVNAITVKNYLPFQPVNPVQPKFCPRNVCYLPHLHVGLVVRLQWEGVASEEARAEE